MMGPRPSSPQRKRPVSPHRKTRSSSLVSKIANKAFERYEEACMRPMSRPHYPVPRLPLPSLLRDRSLYAGFNFHRYDSDNSGTIDANELGKILADMQMHVGRHQRSEEQMRQWVNLDGAFQAQSGPEWI